MFLCVVVGMPRLMCGKLGPCVTLVLRNGVFRKCDLLGDYKMGAARHTLFGLFHRSKHGAQGVSFWNRCHSEVSCD